MLKPTIILGRATTIISPPPLALATKSRINSSFPTPDPKPFGTSSSLIPHYIGFLLLDLEPWGETQDMPFAELLLAGCLFLLARDRCEGGKTLWSFFKGEGMDWEFARRVSAFICDPIPKSGGNEQSRAHNSRSD